MSSTIKKWLSEYKTLQSAELNAYASTVRQNDDLIQELYDLFDDDLSQEVIDPVCHQLFDFYRSLNIELQRFTLELAPTLIWTYLLSPCANDKRKCSGIEVCLLGIYNLEVVDETGKPKVKTTTIPTLATPSLFHEPPSLATFVLTESALSRYHSDGPRTVSIGPFPQVANITATNRLSVITYIIKRYISDIANLSPRSHQMLCRLCSGLTRTGFEELFDGVGFGSLDLNDSLSSGTPRHAVSFADEGRLPRVPVSSELLVELLSGIYYAMFNGQVRDGTQALEDIHWRASYELYADVLLVTNAIKNSLQVNPSGQPKDGPMGISIALSPTQGNPAFLKDAITNASFRARRLPEDIDVQDNMDAPTDGPPEDSADADPTVNGQRSLGTAVADLKSSPLQQKSGSTGKGPLKSIMKKREERAREKTQRKESDMANSLGLAAPPKRGSHIKEFLELHVSKSPRHSVSMSSVVGASTAANAESSSTHGGAVDVSSVQVTTVRSGTANPPQSSDSDTGQTTNRSTSGDTTNAGPNPANASHNAAPSYDNGYSDEQVEVEFVTRDGKTMENTQL